MNFILFKDRFKQFPVFSNADIRKLSIKLYLDRLTDWQKKGYIRRIIKNFYIFPELKLDENALFLIANKIYDPSYVSFESALSYYNLIPDKIFSVVSAGSKKTTTFKTPVGTFMYRKIKPSLLFGFTLVKFDDYSFKIADPEKVILDYFYLNSSLKNEGDFQELRINSEQFIERIDLGKLKRYLAVFQNKSLEKRVNNFLKFIYA